MIREEVISVLRADGESEGMPFISRIPECIPERPQSVIIDYQLGDISVDRQESILFSCLGTSW